MANIFRIEDFVGGWFIGNFTPSLFRNDQFEVSVKYFPQGSREEAHYQHTATEWTVVISGECLIGNSRLGPGDIIEIAPREVAGFEALSDVSLVVVKTPSIPSDKALP